jgi:hypothetical protein
MDARRILYRILPITPLAGTVQAKHNGRGEALQNDTVLVPRLLGGGVHGETGAEEDALLDVIHAHRVGIIGCDAGREKDDLVGPWRALALIEDGVVLARALVEAAQAGPAAPFEGEPLAVNADHRRALEHAVLVAGVAEPEEVF